MPLTRILALGDSVARGTGTATRSYPTLIADHISSLVGYKIALHNLSINGWTSWSLRAEVHNHLVTKWALARSQIILVSIGANDMLSLNAADRLTPWRPPHRWLLARSLSSIHKALTAIRNQAPGAVLIVTNYWNVFRDGDAVPDDGTRVWSRTVTAEFNAGLAPIVHAVGGHLVDLVPVFIPSPHANPVALLDSDGEHPNQAGHQAIADAIMAVLAPACGLTPRT